MATTLPIPVAADSRRDVTRFHPEQYRSFANLAEAFYFNANTNFDLVAYDQAEADPENPKFPRRYVATTQRTTKQRVLKIAAQLEAWGVRSGDTVAILSLNRPEWTEAEMAVYTVGAAAVALYVRVSQERLQHMLFESAAKCVIVENEEQLAAVLQTVTGVQTAFDATNSSESPNGHPRTPPGIESILSFEDVTLSPDRVAGRIQVKTLREVLAEQPLRDELSFAYVETSREDLASIYFTSGSSGMPVGVPVTHGQALENLHQIVAAKLIDYELYHGPNAAATQPIVTLLLPERAHAFPARTTQLVATSPAQARYPAVFDRKSSRINQHYRDSIRRDLREGAAGIVPMVPKILVAIEQRVRERLASGGFRERLAGFVIENASHKILDGVRGTPDPVTNSLYRLLGRLRRRIAGEIRSQIVGPQFGFFISGGAKLPLETASFLWAIGLPVHEGYGSTESNCPIATNTPTQHRLGSVGKLFCDVEMRIDPASHELWLRGPNVVRHYWHTLRDPRAPWTEDGWYRTRDVARQDEDGYLYIEDRVDNILVLWNGENVSATAVEQRFSAIPYVDTAVILGHQRPALIALIALNEEAVRRWAARGGYALAVDWQQDPVVLDLLREQVERHVNRRAGHACERIRQIAVIEPLATEQQTLTATEKVRRREIERRYASLINELYENQDEWLPAFEHETVAAGTK